MDQDAIGEMIPHAASEGEPLTIAAEPQQVGGQMEVLSADHLLVDDRSGIQLGGDVMAGRPDELHAAFVRLHVRIGPGEGGKEGMMDIDDASGPAFADTWGDDLHVASEHDE